MMAGDFPERLSEFLLEDVRIDAEVTDKTPVLYVSDLQT